MLEDTIKNERSWGREEWSEMRSRLMALSHEQVLKLANNVGIKFAGGNENLKDKPEFTAKEQLVLVMDEVSKDLLISEYEKI